MGAVSVRRRGTGSPDPRKTWRAPPATLVLNGIAMEGFVHGQLAGQPPAATVNLPARPPLFYN